MAGGLFGRPFVFNEKCIIFSLLCMLLFLIKPPYHNTFVLYTSLFLIFIGAYVAMAWYDYYFNCNLISLQRGQYSMTGLLKPPQEAQHVSMNKEEKQTVENKRKKILIYLFHIIGIIPFLMYLFYYQNKTPYFVFPLLFVLIVFTFLYHISELLYLIH